MRKLLSGLAVIALVAGAAVEAKPGGGGPGNGGGGGHGGGGNPHGVRGGGGPGGGPGGGNPHGMGGGGGNPFAAMRAHGHSGGGNPFAAMGAGARGHGRGGGGGNPFVMGGAARAYRHAHARPTAMHRPPMLAHASRGHQREAARQHGNRQLTTQARQQRQADRMARPFGSHPQQAMGRASDRAVNAPLVPNRGGRQAFAGRGRDLIEGCPPGLAKKGNGCMPPGLAGRSTPGIPFAAAAGTGLLAGTLNPSWFGYDDYGPDYRYYDGYLLRTDGDNVLGYVPLLGGALAPGEPWLASYQPEPIPDYWTDYYDLGPVDRYRYYDDALYQLDPARSQIEDIVALMTGDPWVVGQAMPYGYDVYNVPYAYRSRYYDGPDRWYRYADGYVYEIDPATRLVRAIVQLLS